MGEVAGQVKPGKHGPGGGLAGDNQLARVGGFFQLGCPSAALTLATSRPALQGFDKWAERMLSSTGTPWEEREAKAVGR